LLFSIINVLSTSQEREAFLQSAISNDISYFLHWYKSTSPFSKVNESGFNGFLALDIYKYLLHLQAMNKIKSFTWKSLRDSKLEVLFTSGSRYRCCSFIVLGYSSSKEGIRSTVRSQWLSDASIYYKNQDKMAYSTRQRQLAPNDRESKTSVARPYSWHLNESDFSTHAVGLTVNNKGVVSMYDPGRKRVWDMLNIEDLRNELPNSLFDYCTIILFRINL
jgi:hypothetical protein